MHTPTDFDRVWNRACKGDWESQGACDSALAALINFHSLAMDGGAVHAVECLTPSQLVSTQNGYRYFGFDDISNLILATKEAIVQNQDLDYLEAKFDKDYWGKIPEDKILVKAFKIHYSSHPQEYSPLFSS